jgi:putative hydrolase of the HAD superfamily
VFVSKGPAHGSARKESDFYMATTPIRAVLFDMGGTLESIYYDQATGQSGALEVLAFLRSHDLDPGLGLPELQAAVVSGMDEYQAWRERSEVELCPARVWTAFIFPGRGLCRERLAAVAEDLSYLQATRFQQRSLRPEAPALLDALCARGFRLGMISNVLSRRLVPSCLAQYGIAHYFEHVVTSAEFGWRKPNRRIFDEAACLMQLPPAACAYVGDTLSRDVTGARRAGYGLAVQIRSFLTDRSDQGIVDVAPDATIGDLGQVLELVSPVAEAMAHG